jgi:hypothetical protein
VLRDILDFRGQKCTFEPKEREGFLMGEPYKITIRHTPGASQPWSYRVVKGGTQLDSGVGVSRREAIARAERFADEYAANTGAECTYGYHPKLKD